MFYLLVWNLEILSVNGFQAQKLVLKFKQRIKLWCAIDLHSVNADGKRAREREGYISILFLEMLCSAYHFHSSTLHLICHSDIIDSYGNCRLLAFGN
jgi:hypothetical protein